ncbi:MAG: hypothetical protein WCR06_07735, partial [bacterium]
MILGKFHQTLQALPDDWTPETRMVLQDSHGRTLGPDSLQDQFEDAACSAKQPMIEATLALCHGCGEAMSGGATKSGVYF